MDYGKVTSAAGIPNVKIGNLTASDGTNTTVSNASNSSSTPVSTTMILAIVLPSSAVLLLGSMFVLRARRRRNEADATTDSPSADCWASNTPANAPGEPAPAARVSSAIGFQTSESAERC